MKKLLILTLCILLLTGCAATYDGPTTTRSVLSSEEYYFSDADSRYESRTEYTYDIYGNQVQSLSYSADAPYLKTVLGYDDAGNIIRQRQYDLSGWFPKKLVDVCYDYDALGRRISERHRYDLRWDDATITYDDTARTRTTCNNGHTTVEYLNENGWVVSSESDFGDGVRITEEFDRREDGQIKAMRTYRDGVLESLTELTYDDQGRPMTYSVTQAGKTDILYRYEYGENYKRIIFSDGSYTVTDYNPDGTPHSRLTVNANDTVQEHTIYRYTDIRVPVGKEETP